MKIACIVAEIQTDVIYWGNFMENKTERYQKAMNIMDVMTQSSFAQIMQKGLAIHELNQKFQGKFKIGSVNGTSLFIEVANAMIRQGFLFQQMELLKIIQAEFPQVKTLEIKVNPEFK